MEVGTFSISLTVKDIAKAKAFYEALGFTSVMGEEQQGWAIMKNGGANVGLFQGMFDKNIITFNPGWDQDGQNVSEFMDIRDIQSRLADAGIEFVQRAEDGDGPASFMIEDPDGNTILFDQHVPRPA